MFSEPLVRGVKEKPLHRPARLDARPFFCRKRILPGCMQSHVDLDSIHEKDVNWKEA